MAEGTHHRHRERLRKRYEHEGLSHFEPHEILELLLFYSIPLKDTNPIAHNLLDRFGSLSNVLEAPVDQLVKVEGVGRSSAVFLHMLPEVFREYEQSKYRNKVVLGTNQEAARFAAAMFIGMTKEGFALISLDSNRMVLWHDIISYGTSNRAIVYPRDVVEAVLGHNIQNVIFAHNHPNGSLAASHEDKILTETLIDALRPLEVNVIDHIIVAGADRYLSMSDAGLMRN